MQRPELSQMSPFWHSLSFLQLTPHVPWLQCWPALHWLSCVHLMHFPPLQIRPLGQSEEALHLFSLIG